MIENTSIIPSSALPAPLLDTILAGQLIDSTLAMYQRDLHAYLRFVEDEGLYWLDFHAFIAWRDHLTLLSTKSPHTINRMMAAVKRVVRELFKREMIDEQIAIRFQHVNGVRVNALKDRLKPHARTRITPEQMRAICEAPDMSTHVGLRDAALLATLASSGIRAEEAATLMLDQVQARDGGYLLLIRGKTDTTAREAHLSQHAQSLIATWLELRPITSRYIFTAFTTRAAKPLDQHISTTTVWNIVTKYAEVCGYAHIKAHDFRRYLGTQLAKKDIRKAQKALGHKDINTTAKHYVLDELEVGLTDDIY